jgi:hypothetical protein
LFDGPDSPESPVSMLCAPKDLSKKAAVFISEDLKPVLNPSPSPPAPPPPKRSKLCIDEILNLKTSPTSVVPTAVPAMLVCEQEQPENLSLGKTAKAEL